MTPLFQLVFVELDLAPAQAQADMEAAKRQQAFFQQHLQELTLFKAKTSAALLQVHRECFSIESVLLKFIQFRKAQGSSKPMLIAFQPCELGLLRPCKTLALDWDNCLPQAEEWASREKREAEALQARYDSIYSQAETQFQGSRSLLADSQVGATSHANANA